MPLEQLLLEGRQLWVHLLPLVGYHLSWGIVKRGGYSRSKLQQVRQGEAEGNRCHDMMDVYGWDRPDHTSSFQRPAPTHLVRPHDVVVCDSAHEDRLHLRHALLTGLPLLLIGLLRIVVSLD